MSNSGYGTKSEEKDKPGSLHITVKKKKKLGGARKGSHRRGGEKRRENPRETKRIVKHSGAWS